MDKFSGTYNLPRLNQEEIKKKIWTNQLSKEIESVIKNLPLKKSPGPDDFIYKFYQTLKEELMLILRLKLFQKVKQDWILQNVYYKVLITLLPKPDKDTTRKLQADIPDEYCFKIFKY